MSASCRLPDRPTKHHDLPFKGDIACQPMIIGLTAGSDPYGFRAGETIRLGFARGWAQVCGPVSFVFMEDLIRELEYHQQPAVLLSEYELMHLTVEESKKLRDTDLFLWVGAHPRTIPQLNASLTVPIYGEQEAFALWEAHNRAIVAEPKFVWNSCGDTAAEYFSPWAEEGFRWEKLYQACDDERYYPEPNPDAFGHVKMAYVGRYWDEKAVSFDAYLREWEDVLWTYGTMKWPYKNFGGPLTETGERQLYSTAGMVPLITSPGGHAIAEITERYFKTPGCGCFCISDVNPALRDIFTEEEMLQAQSVEHFHQLIKDYLAGNIDNQGYAKKAQAAVYERHLYRHRAQQIRGILLDCRQKPSAKPKQQNTIFVSAEKSYQEELGRWFNDRGDQTLRLNYDLDENSVVFDVGGYKGQWAADINCMYGCRVYVFEPVPDFAANITRKFCKNSRIQVFPFGLASQNRSIRLSLDADSSSEYSNGEQYVEGKLVNASEFMAENAVDTIDLIKINTEGGEYDLLEHLIEAGLTTRVRNFQIQFHDIGADSKRRRDRICAALSQTHRITYRYNFVWENWELIPGAELGNFTFTKPAEDEADSIEQIQQLIDSDSENIAHYLRACRLLIEAGNAEEATRYLEDARELEPENPDIQALEKALQKAA